MKTNTHPAILDSGSASTCPAGGSFSGLWANDDFDFMGDAPDGARAEYVFDAPAGTTVTRWIYNRWMGKELTDSWSLYAKYAATPSDVVLDTCHVPGDGDPCSRGVAGFNQAGERTVTGIATNQLTFGFTCVNPTFECGTGSTTIHRIWAALYASTVQLTESTAPAISPGPSGPLLETGRNHRGTETVTFGATDATGIRTTLVHLDPVGGAPETIRGSNVHPCDYTFKVPCSDVGSSTIEVDTRGVPDGQYDVILAAADATYGQNGNLSFNEGRQTAARITVDNVPETTPGGGQGAAAPAPLEAAPTTSAPVSAPIRGAAPSRRTKPRLRIVHSGYRRGRVRFAGRLERDAAKALRVELSSRVGGNTVRATRSLAPAGTGTFRAALRLPRSLMDARRVTLAVRFPGDPLHLPRTIRRTIRLAK
ncbi:MAG: hypothetical protein H0V29_05770 [Thermoleophilaceae bacterium]|nr:hypothetical protein [Thermoleophilaceae bacterium]